MSSNSTDDRSTDYHQSEEKHNEEEKTVNNMKDLVPVSQKKKKPAIKNAAKLLIVTNRMTAKYSVVQKKRLSALPDADKFKNQFFNKSNEFFKKEPRLIPPNIHRFRSLIVLLLILILTFVGIAAPIHYDMSPYYISYAAILGAIFLLFLFLDFWDNFHLFQSKFESSCNGRSQNIFLITFCITAFIDYILIGLEEDDIINGDTPIIIIDVLYYTALVLFLCTWMAYWKTFSFYCSEKSFLHALFYLTIIGYIIIAICRWLRPLESKNENENENENENKDENNENDVVKKKKKASSWHHEHEVKSILSAIMYVIIFLFLFCVILGGIIIAAFAEFARQSAEFGVGIAIIGFCAVSMIIMLTPLAPGSIVDACGGFVFIQLLSDPTNGPNYSFFVSWGIAIVAVCILHFIGACMQWWMGTWPCIQIWANKTLPIEMLAASDAVLRDAGVLKVGLVGYIFMDTANGLNQGRINMDFWIQLFSEWTSIPNALGLVSLGAAIAARALELANMEWTIIAVPLFILFSTLIQSAGATFGARAMGDSTDTVKYWTAREKWTMFQFFRSCGYSPTQIGWTNDVFNLTKINKKYIDKFDTVLYDLVAPLHFNYLKNRDNAKDSEERLKIFEKYRNQLTKTREIHYKNFEKVTDDYIKEGWLLYEQPKTSSSGFFKVGENDTEDLPKWKIKLWIALCITATFAFWGSFYGVYMQSSLQSAVQQGINSLEKVTIFAWICCVIFLFVIIFVYHIEIINVLTNTLSTFKWICFGCKINQDTETKFYTPKYNLPQKYDYKKNNKQQIKDIENVP